MKQRCVHVHSDSGFVLIKSILPNSLREGAKASIGSKLVAGLCLLVACILGSSNAISQDSFGSELPSPVSPTAAALGKYGEIPVDLHTGAGMVSVPLHTIRGRTLNVPLALNYHASGIRVPETPSWVGMGWSIPVGGVITRAKRGLADDQPTFGYMDYGPTTESILGTYDSSQNPYDLLPLMTDVKNLTGDSEPDLFYFNLGGTSGAFALGPDGVPRTIPDMPLEIEVTQRGSTQIGSFSVNGVLEWKITTADGTVYILGGSGAKGKEAVQKTSLPPFSNFTAWHVTEIRSPYGDAVNVSHTSTMFNTVTYNGYTERYIHSNSGENCSNGSSIVPVNYFREVRIWPSRVQTASEQVDLISSARSSSSVGGGQERKLDEIRVYNSSSAGETLRHKVVLGYAYQSNRLRLESVTEVGADGAEGKVHTFEYYGGSIPGRLSKGIDHLGYANGQGNSGLIPTVALEPPYPPEVNGANRDPNFNRAVAGSLKKVHYPTGGESEIFYEGHDYGTIQGNPADLYMWQSAGTMTVGGPYGSSSESMTVDVDVRQGNADNLDVEFTYTQIGAVGPSPAPRYSVTNSSGQVVGSGVFTGGFTSCDTQPAPTRTQVVRGSYPVGQYTISISCQNCYRENGTCPSYASFDSMTLTASARKMTRVTNKVASGIRVKAIHHEEPHSAEMVTEFEYKLQDEPTRSSGDVQVEPRYHYYWGDGLCVYAALSSSPLLPLTGSGANRVSYREVTVRQGTAGEDGKTVSQFTSTSEYPDSFGSTWWPAGGVTNYDWKRGLPTSVKIYSGSSGAYELLQSRDTSYLGLSGSSRVARALTIKTSSCASSSGTTIPSSGCNTFYDRYDIRTGWVRPETKVVTTYPEN